MSYKDLRGKLSEYLARYYEDGTVDYCLSDESFYANLSEKKAMVPPPPICASAAPSFGNKPRSLDNVAEEIEDTFSQHLFRLIDQKGRKEVRVYKDAGISRQVFSKIRSNKNYVPKKETALALCISLHLSLDETEDLIGKAGYALSKSSLFDMIIKFFIEEEVYDIGVINEALDDHEEHLLIG